MVKVEQLRKESKIVRVKDGKIRKILTIITSPQQNHLYFIQEKTR